MSRDTIRRLTLGKARQFRRELVVLRDVEQQRVMEDDGHRRHPPVLDEAGAPIEVEVREPSIAARAAILRASKVQSGKADDVDLAALQLEAVLSCVYVPGTQQLVFEAGDKKALLEQPSGGYFDELAGVALRLMNVEAAEESAGNSIGTVSA